MKGFRFKMGDRYLVWRVVGRESDEILLEWSWRGLQGTTWFHIPSNENVLVFGSSIPLPRVEERHHASIPMKLYMDASRNLPPDAPVGLKVRAAVIKTLVKVVTVVHVTYSKYLLLSTYHRLLEEEEEKKERGELG